MEDIKRTIRRILNVLVSNVALIASSVVVSFIIPNILTIEDYGYYRTFSLYLTYAGIFSFGLTEGIVLKYGGSDYNELVREDFRTYFKWLLVINLFFSVTLSFISSLFINNEYRFIFYALSINIFALNISSHFQQISQITLRVKEYSFRRILQAILNVAIVMFLLFSANVLKNEVNYKMYIVLLVAMNIVLALWYIYTYRDISFGKSHKMFELEKDVFDLCKNGLPLLFANLSSAFFMILDRQFINIAYPNKTYAIYSFAYSMLSLITVATSAVHTIMYPTIKRVDYDSLKSSYKIASETVLLLLTLMLFSYFPLVVIVNTFIPKYIDSLSIFRIIMPCIVVSSTITVTMRSYYKALNESTRYFRLSIVAIVASFLLDLVCFFTIKTIESLSISSLFVVIAWYILCEDYLVKLFSLNRWKNLCYIILCFVAFFVASSLKNLIFGALLFLLVYLCLTYILYREDIRKMWVLYKK